MITYQLTAATESVEILQNGKPIGYLGFRGDRMGHFWGNGTDSHQLISVQDMAAMIKILGELRKQRGLDKVEVIV